MKKTLDTFDPNSKQKADVNRISKLFKELKKYYEQRLNWPKKLCW